MQGKWERMAAPFLQWVAIPLSVFGFGFFVIGPWLSGAQEDEPGGQTISPETSLANKLPIEPGERKWIPVQPPQVNISVTRKDDTEDEPPLEEFDEAEPPPIEVPDDTTIDEAGVGGLRPPIARGDQGSTAGGDDDNDSDSDDDNDGLRSAFRGVGSDR